MTSEQQYERIKKGKPRDAIFGITVYDTQNYNIATHTEKGTTNHAHNDFREFRKLFRELGDYPSLLRSWRYIPEDNIVFWWDNANDDLKQEAEYHLFKKYKVKNPTHKRIHSYKVDNTSNRLARLLSHGPEFAYGMSHPKMELPSFKEYLKYRGYKHEGD